MSNDNKKFALSSLKVLELEGQAPSCMLGMILSDYGAEVVLVSKFEPVMISPLHTNLEDFDLHRGKKSITLDQKLSDHKKILLELVRSYDVLIDPFRPGVLERLGLGIDKLAEYNPKIILARVSSFGQTGKQSNVAAHDINFASVSGIWSTFQSSANDSNKKYEPPVQIPPFLGDGCAPVLIAFGVLAAYIKKQTGYQYCQIVDGSLCESVLYMGSITNSMYKVGMVTNKRDGSAFLSKNSPYYSLYQTKDEVWYSLGAVEAKFFKNFQKEIGFTQKQIDFHMKVQEYLDTDNFLESKNLIQKKFEERDSEFYDKLIKINHNICLLRILDIDQMEHMNDLHRECVVNDTKNNNSQTTNGLQILPGTKIIGQVFSGNNNIGEKLFYDVYRKGPNRGQHNTEVLLQGGIDSKTAEKVHKLFINFDLDRDKKPKL